MLEKSGKQGIERYEFSLFSQNGEDGVLKYLFSEVGFTSRLFLEFGFSVVENNSLRLILHEGFGGVFIDGNDLPVREFNRAAQSSTISDVHAINSILNLGNLETTIVESGFPHEIDLLSIDVDGNDYWFWEALVFLSPRIVAIEYNAGLGSELAIVVPCDPHFDRLTKHPSGHYFGASITSLEKSGKKKGFHLVGYGSEGINAFFVSENCLTENLNVLSPKNSWRPKKSEPSNNVKLK